MNGGGSCLDDKLVLTIHDSDLRETGLYLMNTDGSSLREVVHRANGYFIWQPRFHRQTAANVEDRLATVSVLAAWAIRR